MLGCFAQSFGMCSAARCWLGACQKLSCHKPTERNNQSDNVTRTTPLNCSWHHLGPSRHSWKLYDQLNHLLDGGFEWFRPVQKLCSTQIIIPNHAVFFVSQKTPNKKNKMFDVETTNQPRPRRRFQTPKTKSLMPPWRSQREAGIVPMRQCKNRCNSEPSKIVYFELNISMESARSPSAYSCLHMFTCPLAYRHKHIL